MERDRYKAWVAPLVRETCPKASVLEWDSQLERFGRMTNMKKTLARSPLALDIFMQWYALRDAAITEIGERGALIFVHAVSSATDCLICSTYFRRLLIEGGEDPDALTLTQHEQQLATLGRAIAKGRKMDSSTRLGLGQWLCDDALVLVCAFGAQMLATNVFNNTLGVELDEYLWPYKKTPEKGVADA